MTLPTSDTLGPNIAYSRAACLLASEYSWPCAEKIAEFRGSRRKAWTARIPPNVSTNCTMTSAMASLVRR